ncbi:MAG: hypothetical protein A2V70_03885 [Planctomycetes bacterium RBG_13_63_9]|nr:MAG: hypothetical protein A2V70_03885 [Planctomycetes bacterium RBG_13_63_9]
MSLLKIAWRSIQQRALASALTAVSMGLGVALVVAILIFFAVIEQSFRRGGTGYDLIVGAKGSRLQLVLNSVYYLDRPIGNIPYSYYEEFIEGEFAFDVEAAIPICMGHSYKDFQVVGTTPEMFRLKYFFGEEERECEFIDAKEKGTTPENFKWETPYDAVLGWTAAREARLKVGDTFKARHGEGEGAKHHQREFTVVGILGQTGMPNDRALFVNMEGFYQIHEHESKQPHAEDEHADDEHHHDDKAVTAILVCIDPYKPLQWQVLERKINNGPVAQAVIPRMVIAELFEGIVGNVELILLIMAVLTVVVAGTGIMVSIYNSMSDRRHEIAVMRALGASRQTVMIVILLESILLSLGGGVLGLLLGHGLIAAFSPMIVQWTGVAVGLLHFRLIELILIPGLIVLATAVGYLPAVAAYRTDVARSLTVNP